MTSEIKDLENKIEILNSLILKYSPALRLRTPSLREKYLKQSFERMTVNFLIKELKKEKDFKEFIFKKLRKCR